MIVDLSVIIDQNTPVYPGDLVVTIKPVGIFAKDGYNDSLLSIGTHVGTHIDAPLHMIDGGKSLNQIPVERFVGRGRCIGVENKQFDIQAVKNAEIQSGDIVLFNTGLDEVFDHPEVYFKDYPALPEEIANYLIEKHVSMVGFDMCSPDHPDFAIHKLLLGSDVLIIENLTNLDKLAGKEFRVTALPLNLKTDGSPARVIAEVE
jgi:arylformamidase